MYRISGYPAHFSLSGIRLSGIRFVTQLSGIRPDIILVIWYPAGYRIIALLAVTGSSRNTPLIVVVLGEDHDVVTSV